MTWSAGWAPLGYTVESILVRVFISRTWDRLGLYLEMQFIQLNVNNIPVDT